MESWIKCEDGCGNCRLSITDDRFLFIDPSNLLEWAHSAIDFIEDSFNDFVGIPLRYFITCTYEARIYGQITPINDSRYIRSQEFKRDLMEQCISTISHTMMIHSNKRRDIAQTRSSVYNILSINDLISFQSDMTTQSRFSIIHAALDEISIVRSDVRPRVQKTIKQRSTKGR